MGDYFDQRASYQERINHSMQGVQQVQRPERKGSAVALRP